MDNEIFVKDVFKIVKDNPNIEYNKYFELVSNVLNNNKSGYPIITEEQLASIDTTVVKQIINEYVTEINTSGLYVGGLLTVFGWQV